MYDISDNFVKYSSVSTKLVLGNDENRDVFFSVIIPTYKRGELIIPSLQSAINQNGFDDYEIIIVDNNSDFSNDSTYDVVGGFNDERIAYYINDENIGMCGNWNRCIELAHGQYIVMLHDDDVLSPYCLKHIYETIQKNDYPAVVGVGYEKFSGENVPSFSDYEELNVFKLNKYGFFFGETINITGLTFKKDLSIKLGGFNEDYYPNEDTFFIYQAISFDRVVGIKEALAGYRVEDNLSLSGDTLNQIILKMQLFREYVARNERFAKVFMGLFDTEYLYQYVNSANAYWSKDIDFSEISEETNLKRKRVSKCRLLLMKAFLKINS